MVYLLLMLALVLAACDSSPSPMAPSPLTPPQATPRPTLQRLSGYVFDTASRAVPGAIVEVLDGPLAGTSLTSDAFGAFLVSGSFSAGFRLRASKEGYVTATAPVQVSASDGRPWVTFVLAMQVPPVNLAGDYTLTITADPAACAGLPNDARSRSYHATITPASAPGRPANTTFDVTVSGASLLDNYNAFVLYVAADYFSTEIGDLHAGEPGLVEMAGVNTYVALGGWTTASVAAPVSTISASIEGSIEYCALASPMGSRYSCASPVAYGHCDSRNHRLTLTRQ
jgi:hypothetical protein